MSAPSPDIEATAAALIARWSAAQSAERANYAMFLTELCDVLGVPRPDPAGPDTSLSSNCRRNRGTGMFLFA